MKTSKSNKAAYNKLNNLKQKFNTIVITLSIVFMGIATSSVVKAQNEFIIPFIPDAIPVIDWSLNSENCIDFTASSSTSVNEIFFVYKSTSIVPKVMECIGYIYLADGDVLSLNICPPDPLDDIIIEVTCSPTIEVAGLPNTIVGLVIWRDTIPASIFMPQLDPSNPANPYDIWGKTHNDIILNFLNNSTYQGSNFDTFKMEYYSLRLDYLISNNPYNVSNTEYDSLNQYSLHPFIDTNRYHHYYIDSLVILIYRIDMEGNIGINNDLIPIRLLEATIINDNNIDSATKKMLLIRTSIARYSAALWYEQFHNTNSVFLEYCEEHEELIENIPPMAGTNRISPMQEMILDMGYALNDIIWWDATNIGGDWASMGKAIEEERKKQGIE